MVREPSSEVYSALALLRRGRFVEMINALQRHAKDLRSHRKTDSLVEALLADALQRTGCNKDAELTAARSLQKIVSTDVGARLHFVLGNVTRERGEISKAVE